MMGKSPLSSPSILMKRSLVFLGFGLLALLLITVGVVVLAPEGEPGPYAGPLPPAGSRPPIAWTPDHLVVTLTPGESKTVEVNARITDAIPPTTAEFVPSLAPYASAVPVDVPAMGAGTEQEFALHFEVPDDTPFQTIEGTLHLRAGEATSSKPLPIRLSVWPTAQTDAVYINYPPSWSATEVADPDITAIEISSPGGSNLTVLPNGGSQYDIIGDDFDETRSVMIVGGFNAVRHDVGANGVFILSRLELTDVPGYPAFAVELRLGLAADRPLLEEALESLVIGVQP